MSIQISNALGTETITLDAAPTFLSEAHALGVYVSWPGPRHAAYPELWTSDGKRFPLVKDSCGRHERLASVGQCTHCRGSGVDPDVNPDPAARMPWAEVAE